MLRSRQRPTSGFTASSDGQQSLDLLSIQVGAVAVSPVAVAPLPNLMVKVLVGRWSPLPVCVKLVPGVAADVVQPAPVQELPDDELFGLGEVAGWVIQELDHRLRRSGSFRCCKTVLRRGRVANCSRFSR